MRKLYSSVTGIDQGDTELFSDFKSDGEMWNGTGPRERLIHVEFKGTFRSVPIVQISLKMIDMASDTNQRFDLGVKDVSQTGFTIQFKTWSDTRIARASATWTAIGEAYADGDWDLTQNADVVLP